MNRYILPFIVFAQFCGTSVWFAGNAIIEDLVANFQLTDNALGQLTSAIQFGFIIGTLVFALLSIADRFSPSKVFFICALLAALLNMGMTFPANTYGSLLTLRFLTGICLAGIYPVGMKIAADYFEKGLGKSLGFLVGALVLGTAFPHLLNLFDQVLQWKQLMYVVSTLAGMGGLLILVAVPDGPYRKAATHFRMSGISAIFKPKAFRTAAYGYFGHMWELYTFWAFVPVLLISFQQLHPKVEWNISLLSFSIIAIGSLGCVLAGYLSQRYGSAKVAYTALSISGVCCLILPLLFYLGIPILFLSVLLIWGAAVVADSPLFSTLVAQSAIPSLKGTALTIVNSIGFAITIVSIQLFSLLTLHMDIAFVFMILAIGPLAGLLYKKKN
ncbi:MAG: MFS family permease [Marivirga sp.]|jgi:MFS family permease